MTPVTPRPQPPALATGPDAVRKIFALSRRARSLADVLRRLSMRRASDYDRLLADLAVEYSLEPAVVQDVVSRELRWRE